MDAATTTVLGEQGSVHLDFFVPGLPRGAGSKRGFVIRRKTGKLGVTLTDDTGALGKEWRGSVQFFARQAYGGAPLDGPVALIVTFVLPRPKSHFTKRGLRPTAPYWHTSRPDRTKLLRQLEDSLTGICWRDDSQVVTGVTDKVYGERPGARIVVMTLDPTGAMGR